MCKLYHAKTLVNFMYKFQTAASMQTMFPAVVFWLTNLQNNLTVDVWNEASQHYFKVSQIVTQ